MKEHIEYCKDNAFNRWNILVVAVVIVLLAAALTVALLPRSTASVATVYVEGKKMITIDLGEDVGHVYRYNGVIVRVNNGRLETVYHGHAAGIGKVGQKIVYPTAGVVVEVA